MPAGKRWCRGEPGYFPVAEFQIEHGVLVHKHDGTPPHEAMTGVPVADIGGRLRVPGQLKALGVPTRGLGVPDAIVVRDDA